MSGFMDNNVDMGSFAQSRAESAHRRRLQGIAVICRAFLSKMLRHRQL
jgi:hypothetical protein